MYSVAADTAHVLQDISFVIFFVNMIPILDYWYADICGVELHWLHLIENMKGCENVNIDMAARGILMITWKQIGVKYYISRKKVTRLWMDWFCILADIVC